MSQTTTKILVVDNDQFCLSEIKESLLRMHFDVFLALSTQQALDVVACETLHLVVSNQLIQPQTGVGLRSLVHSVPQNANVPFLYTSASQIPDIISRRIGDRNVFFVRKPLDRATFATLVEFALLPPKLIQSHIQSAHQRRGLNAPHREHVQGKVLPTVHAGLGYSSPVLQPPF